MPTNGGFPVINGHNSFNIPGVYVILLYTNDVRNLEIDFIFFNLLIFYKRTCLLLYNS